MHIYQLGNWTLAFDKPYRIVKDETTAVVIDDERSAVTLISLKDGNIRIERTYYAMIYEFVAGENLVRFYTVD